MPLRVSFVSDGYDDVRFVVFRSFVLWEYVIGNYSGVYFIVSLSFCIPSCVAYYVCSVWSSCGVVVSSFVCALMSFADLLPRSRIKVGHLPPL